MAEFKDEDSEESDYEEDMKVMVVDNGSYSMKTGLAGYDAPIAVFPSIVARPNINHIQMGQPDCYIGNKYKDNNLDPSSLNLSHPIQHRMITNWDDMEKIWHHTFYKELNIVPEETGILLTECVLNPKANKEKAIQIMFETFNVPSCYHVYQQTLPLYAAGKTCGFVIDSGYQNTHIVPIYEGYALPHAVQRSECGGYHISKQVMSNELFKSLSVPMEIARDIKEKYCFFGLNDNNIDKNDIVYTLPDGREINISSKLQSDCTEIIFEPGLMTDTMNHGQEGIVKLFNDSVMKCDSDIRKTLFQCMVLSGGNFMLKGIDERLIKELDAKNVYGFDIKIECDDQCNRDNLVFLGGSILGTMQSFIEMMTTKDEYDESGPGIVHRKCFGGGGGWNNTAPTTIGLAVGGSKDVSNFRECIENNVMPKESAITFEGIYYEYYFETEKNLNEDESKEEKKKDDDALFYPSYLYSKSVIPESVQRIYDDMNNNDDDNKCSDKYEHFLSVGLNSNLKQDDFKRNKLNLIIVLDISGSMSSSFNYNEQTQKMNIANNAVIGLLKHLDDDDRFGLILFNTEAFIKQSLELMSKININELKDSIINIKANGGTNMEIGYKTAIEQYNNIESNDDYDNRVIFLTDALPNTGYTDSDNLLDLIGNNAERDNNKIYTTVIGVGIDFNTDLVQRISTTRGSNYFCVKSNDEFLKRMDDEFEYMVTPIVFNLKLNVNVEGNACYIYKVFGSNEDNHNDNDKNMIENKEMMNINTLFPTKKSDDGESKGGVILLQIKKKMNDENDSNLNIKIEVNYEDGKGNKYSNDENISIDNQNDNDMIQDDIDYFDNIGIRKAVLLTRYVLLIKKWINSTNSFKTLTANEKYKNIFEGFSKYFEKEMKQIGDDSLDKELKILQKLTTM